MTIQFCEHFDRFALRFDRLDRGDSRRQQKMSEKSKEFKWRNKNSMSNLIWCRRREIFIWRRIEFKWIHSKVVKWDVAIDMRRIGFQNGISSFELILSLPSGPQNAPTNIISTQPKDKQQCVVVVVFITADTDLASVASYRFRAYTILRSLLAYRFLSPFRKRIGENVLLSFSLLR